MPQRIDDQTVEKILEMRKNGATNREITDAIGVSEMTISKYCKANGLESKHYKGGIISRHLSPAEIQQGRKVETEPEEDWTFVNEHSVEFVGVNTLFKYKASTKGKDLVIVTPYSDPFTIDIKDLVNFSNELMSVATKVEKLRKDG